MIGTEAFYESCQRISRAARKFNVMNCHLAFAGTIAECALKNQSMTRGEIAHVAIVMDTLLDNWSGDEAIMVRATLVEFFKPMNHGVLIA